MTTKGLGDGNQGGERGGGPAPAPGQRWQGEENQYDVVSILGNRCSLRLVADPSVVYDDIGVSWFDDARYLGPSPTASATPPAGDHHD